jgi:hypothetical protein
MTPPSQSFSPGHRGSALCDRAVSPVMPPLAVLLATRAGVGEHGGMPVRLVAALGLGAVALCAVLVGSLHGLATEVNPIRRTISEYAIGEFGWMFDVAVLGLAVGSLLVLLALVGAGLLGRSSGGAVALGVWSVTLVLVVAFEKANWSIGPSVGGYIHRYASLAAFVALPVAALAVGRRWRAHPRFGRYAAVTRWLGALSLGWLSTIVLGVFLRPLTGVPWWQFVPLGLVERGLAVTEVAAVIVLGAWAWRAAGTRDLADTPDAVPATA